MGCSADHGAAPVVTQQQLFLHQGLDRLAHGAQGDAVEYRQLGLGGNQAAGLPFAGIDALLEQRSQFAVTGGAALGRRGAGGFSCHG